MASMPVPHPSIFKFAVFPLECGGLAAEITFGGIYSPRHQRKNFSNRGKIVFRTKWDQ
jgi:hypothetical protein